MTDCVYFDITDIVRYARHQDRVAGIPRVQINLMSHLWNRHGAQRVRCVFHHPQRGGMFEFDPGPLLQTPEFDASTLMQRLGLETVHPYLPRQRTVKAYLRRYDDNKLLRAWKKAEVHVLARWRPQRLAALGLPRPVPAEALPLLPLERLPAGAHYVLLNIDGREVLEFAARHRAQGGHVVQLVHDLIPWVCPDLFKPERVREFTGWLDQVVALRPQMLANSQWTARDLRGYLGDAAREFDIRVVPLAHEFFGRERNARVPAGSSVPGRLPTRPFVLCVGTLENRKNGVRLLRAWEQVVQRLGDAAPELVFGGALGWHIEEFLQVLATPSLAGHVRIVEAPSDQELAWLYGQCLFSTYPSLYEGWGLPVGEAAWFGKFCVASDASSLPEVCGDLAAYVDPKNVEDIARGLIEAISDPAGLARREQAIRAAPLRRWADVADDVYAAVTAGGDSGRKAA